MLGLARNSHFENIKNKKEVHTNLIEWIKLFVRKFNNH